MEDKKVAKYTVSCPCCGNTLAYEDKDKSVECFACDNSFDTSKLGGSSSGAQSNMGGFSPLAASGGFDNPESGVVFIENFFETYDWTEYYESNELFINEIADIVKKEFDLRPYSIIKTLDLRKPIYKKTAAYGHFGRSEFPWEKLDRVEDLKKYVK